MNEIEKRKIAKEIKINIRIIIFSFMIGIISYPLLALYDGGFKAIYLNNNYDKIINIGLINREKLNEFSHEVISLGYKNNTLRHDIYYSDWSNLENFDPIRDSLLERFKKSFLVFGEVYEVSTATNSSRIIIYLYSYNLTLRNTIDKIFGQFGIIRSIWIFLISSLGIISFRYIFIFTKKTIIWINKYSE